MLTATKKTSNTTTDVEDIGFMPSVEASYTPVVGAGSEIILIDNEYAKVSIVEYRSGIYEHNFVLHLENRTNKDIDISLFNYLYNVYFSSSLGANTDINETMIIRTKDVKDIHDFELEYTINEVKIKDFSISIVDNIDKGTCIIDLG